jgi:uncharacterized protein
MPRSESRVATEKPAPYMKQLCKHFGHKVDVTFDDAAGSIALPMGRCELDASAPGALILRVSATDGEGLERMEHVIGSHLERFGRRDELSVRWSVPTAA